MCKILQKRERHVSQYFSRRNFTSIDYRRKLVHISGVDIFTFLAYPLLFHLFLSEREQQKSGQRQQLLHHEHGQLYIGQRLGRPCHHERRSPIGLQQLKGQQKQHVNAQLEHHGQQ